MSELGIDFTSLIGGALGFLLTLCVFSYLLGDNALFRIAIHIFIGTAAGFVAQNADKLKMVGSVFTDENYGIAICKTKPELQAKINQGLAAIKANGTFDALLTKYDLVAK